MIFIFILKTLESNEDVEENMEHDDDQTQQVEDRPMSVIELLVAHREEVNQKKLKIAEMSLNIVENPYDNVSISFKCMPLFVFCPFVGNSSRILFRYYRTQHGCINIFLTLYSTLFKIASTLESFK